MIQMVRHGPRHFSVHNCSWLYLCIPTTSFATHKFLNIDDDSEGHIEITEKDDKNIIAKYRR